MVDVNFKSLKFSYVVTSSFVNVVPTDDDPDNIEDENWSRLFAGKE